MLQTGGSIQNPLDFGENSGVNVSRGAGGRPSHTHWHGFIRISDRGKSVAQCMKCRNLIKNTASARMAAHRQKCPLDTDHPTISTNDAQVTQQQVDILQISPPAIPQNTYIKSESLESPRGVGGGRPNHKYWHGFTKISENGRTAAQCIKCKNLLRNTSSARMGAHRLKCKIDMDPTTNTDNDEHRQTLDDDHHISQEHEDNTDYQPELKIKRLVESPREFDEDDTAGSGRTKHKHWHGFRRLYEKGKTIAQCIQCRQFVRNTAIVRMKAHRRRCPIDGYEAMNEDDEQQQEKVEIEDDSQRNLLASSPFSVRSSTPPEPAIFFDIDSFASRSHKNEMFSKTDKSKLDTLLAKFMITCNVPFAAVGNKFLNDFCGQLQPSYTPPSKNYLMGPLLEKLHKEQMDNNATFLHTISCAVLLIDEWNNTSIDSTNITALLHNWGHRIFLESQDIPNDKTLSNTIEEIVKRSKHLTQENYKVDIFAVVTNTECNNETVQLQSDLIHIMCNAQTGNLLVKDIINKYGGGVEGSCLPWQNVDHEDGGVLDKVYTIFNEFKKPILEKKLCSLGGTTPKLPCGTQWCSERDTLSWFNENLIRMKQISLEKDNQGKPLVKSEVIDLLKNEKFIKSITSLHDLLNPVAVLMKNCKKSIYSIADATEEWLDLLADASEELHEIASRRCEKSNVFNKYALSANLLHPLYRGAQLSAEQMTLVEKFLHEKLDKNGQLSFADYKKAKGIFSVLFEKTTQPDLFWNMAQKQHSSLASFALKILMIPASTAQLKDIVSDWSHVSSGLRNSERSKKLLEVYLSLKLNEQSEIYRHFDGNDSSDEYQ
ncbi:uncharacterized protein [Musca autumnalis]|uniref:uncharacterized protein n=1 Tax=Musca autumnalis TaxID=221902 RepID=UPI003CF13EBD